VVNVIPGIKPSPKQQQIEQAQRDFVNAVVRQESGAEIPPREFDNAQKQYFPQPGDSQAVIKQKTRNRETAIRGLEIAAGPGMLSRQAAPPAAPPVSPPAAGNKPERTVDFSKLK